MNNKFLKIGGIILGIILLGIIIWLIATQKEKQFKKITINTTNFVVNTTNKSFIDTIHFVGMNELNVTGATVFVTPLTDKVKSKLNDMDYQALLTGENGFYTLFVGDFGRDYYITILSHELTHLKQYETKRLIITNNVPFWEGKEWKVQGILYTDRPWEAEAFNNQTQLGNKIRKILY